MSQNYGNKVSEADYIDYDDEQEEAELKDVKDKDSTHGTKDIKEQTLGGGKTAKKAPAEKTDALTISNLYSYFVEASEKKNKSMLAKVSEFVSQMRPIDAIHSLSSSQNKDNGDLKEMLSKRLMTCMYELKDSDIKVMGYDVLVMLISRNDYEYSRTVKVFDLENTLCNTVSSWFRHHPAATGDDLKNCFNKLRKSLLIPDAVSRIVICSQYKSVEKDMAPEIVTLYTNNLLNVRPTEKQRFETHLEEQEKGVMTEVQAKALKVGDVIDAKDTSKFWYVGTVMDITPHSLLVTYSGWPSPKFDEVIEFSEKRLAKRGTMTNGKLHKDGGDCGCMKCKDKCNCSNPSCQAPSHASLSNLTPLSGNVGNMLMQLLMSGAMGNPGNLSNMMGYGGPGGPGGPGGSGGSGGPGNSGNTGGHN